MKHIIAIVASIFVFSAIESNAFSSSFVKVPLKSSIASGNTLKMEYIPSGMSKEQWKALKEAEQKKLAGKNLGKTGRWLLQYYRVMVCILCPEIFFFLKK